MNIPILLETAISLFALLTIMSILSSSIFELIESRLRRRSKFLKRAIDQALEDPGLSCNYAVIFYEHPQIKTLQRTNLDYPSYIDPRVFSQVLVDILIKQYELEQLIYNRETMLYELPLNIKEFDKEQRLKEALKAVENSELGRLLDSFRNTSDQINHVEDRINIWYNAYMERLGGWFKRSTQKWLFIFGFVIAAGLNFDLIKITEEIYTKSEIREKVVLYAEGMKLTEGGELDEDELKVQIKKNYQALNSFGLTIGWNNIDWGENRSFTFMRLFLGWLLTAVAVTRGSSFWFNSMNKLINLRSAGTKSETQKDKKDE